MTRAQKTVLVVTLVAVSSFLHTLFCDFQSGIIYTGSNDFHGGKTRVIISFGANSGIVGRSRDTVVRDGMLGVALPMLLIGSAAFVMLTPKRAASEAGRKP